MVFSYFSVVFAKVIAVLLLISISQSEIINNSRTHSVEWLPDSFSQEARDYRRTRTSIESEAVIKWIKPSHEYKGLTISWNESISSMKCLGKTLAESKMLMTKTEMTFTTEFDPRTGQGKLVGRHRRPKGAQKNNFFGPFFTLAKHFCRLFAIYEQYWNFLNNCEYCRHFLPGCYAL